MHAAFSFTFTFMHLADAFMQSDLQYALRMYILRVFLWYVFDSFCYFFAKMSEKLSDDCAMRIYSMCYTTNSNMSTAHYANLRGDAK